MDTEIERDDREINGGRNRDRNGEVSRLSDRNREVNGGIYSRIEKWIKTGIEKRVER